MDKTGYICPICASKDTIFVCDEDDESEYDDICESVNVECLKCGYQFSIEEPD
ncbi:MAG: hypothetical protein K2N34_09470 [Lachnospiraceae bacterium]|nr:hypothetical protein [Lachnospiraceae bacterium]